MPPNIQTSGDSAVQNSTDRFKSGDGANFSQTEGDGTLRFQGSATVWDDINISLVPPHGGAAEPGIIAANEATYNRVYAFSGTNATPDQKNGSLEVLHPYREGTDIRFHIHWAPTTADAGNVRWLLEYQWYNRGTGVPAATQVTLVEAASGVAWREQTSVFILSGTGKTMGSRLIFTLIRDATDVLDTYAHNAAMLDMGVHYEKDTVGSRQILVK